MAKHGPLATKVIDNRIVEAECSLCCQSLDLGNDVGSQEEQSTKMWSVFNKHMKASQRIEKRRFVRAGKSPLSTEETLSPERGTVDSAPNHGAVAEAFPLVDAGADSPWRVDR